MEQEASKLVPTDMRQDLVLSMTDMELYLVLRHGAPNKSPRWDGISVEFHITYWDVMKDNTLMLYNQMFWEAEITAVQNNRSSSWLSKDGIAVGTGDYRPTTLLNADCNLLARILTNSMRQTL